MAETGNRFTPRNYRVIAFDWDGTLVDSTAIIATSLQRACADLGLCVPDDRAARHVIGLGLEDALRYVAPDLSVDRHPELALRYREHYLVRDPDIPLFPGALKLLRDLKLAGYSLAIATGKSRKGLDRALGQLGVLDLFDSTRCGDESPPKPHPDMLLCLAGHFGITPAQMLMIGDTTHDVQMARNAGAAVVAVTYGAHPTHQLAQTGVTLVHSVAELSAWIRQKG